MLELLDGTEEYNNAGALLGLEGAESEELLGALRRMNPIARQRTINKLANPGAGSKGSRAEMEKHFRELPDSVQKLLGHPPDKYLYYFTTKFQRTKLYW